ncbi:MAG: PDZ domain-containing protein [Gammaproteobacteria bacterium]|nr:PDZ domain-containing protein [Gammaproteobacteria bacterium]
MFYQVAFNNANAHLFDVTLSIDFALEAGQVFNLPNWIPGSYMIRDFSKNISKLKAVNQLNETIELKKMTKSSWQLTQSVSKLDISYQVYAWDLSVRTAHLDQHHAFFNGSSLFLSVEGYEEQPHQLAINPTELAVKNHWKVASTMPVKHVDESGFGEYISENYEELIDHPFEIANFDLIEFDVYGVKHQMVFTEAPDRVDYQRIADDVKKICEAEVKMFGDSKPPFEQYIFMTLVLKNGFGGLEHRSSTALHCSASDLPLLGQKQMTEGYRTFLSLCCHEYFHNWNVKRIKPAVFVQPDLSGEVYTELLWFFEGVTSYYDELLMVRSGVIKETEYLDMLAKTITRVMKGKGRLKQSVAESSFYAWNKFYKQDENAINSIVSYYAKGAMVALCLDLTIRKLTNGSKSLDDVMVYVWENYAKKGKGIEEGEIESITEKVVGRNLDDFFKMAVYSTEDLPVESLLTDSAINCQFVSQTSHEQKGGYSDKPVEQQLKPFLGILHKDNGSDCEVVSVLEDSPASQAGLSNGDIIVAIDNFRVTSKELDGYIIKLPLEHKPTISYFRRNRLYHTEVHLQVGQASICFLSLNSDCDTSLTAKRNQWLYNQALRE